VDSFIRFLFFMFCPIWPEIRGHALPDSMITILDDKEGNAKLPAKVAWKIDEKRMKFIKFPIAGLLCPRSGVITADGDL
jgi:hypothetical protein